MTTVQRWEQTEGMPVHRHPHAKKGSVYAFRQELADWRRSRAESIEPESTPNLDAVREESRRRPATVVVVGVIAVTVGLVGYPFYKGTAADPSAVAPKGIEFLQSASGQVLTRVRLQGGTATFSQAILGGPFSPSQAIDRYFNPSNGWTIARAAADGYGTTQAATAVWETGTDVTASDLTFRLHFLHFNPTHLLGRFRFSVTTDPRDQFADELHTDGDVEANWDVLQAPIVTGPAGMTFTTLADQSVLVGGSIAGEGVYSITYRLSPSRITGVRLEALKDPSLPGGGGPGLYAPSGNFFLTEIEMMVAEGRLAVVP